MLAASWTTSLGDGVASAAGPLLVASLTQNPLLVSLAALLRWAPPLAFGLYAGVLSDRLNRRRIVIVADATRVIVLAALIAMMASGRVTVVVVLVALGLLATAEVFSDNTTGTLAPMLVRRDDLALANSRLQTGFITLNQLAGPPIGAALFAIGRVWPSTTEAILVAAGIVLISRVTLPAHGRGDADEARSLRQDIAEAFRWTVRHAAVRTLSLTILIFNITFGAAWSVLVLYVHQRLGLGVVGYGLLTTVSAVGGLLGTAVYGWITKRVSLGNVMRVGLILETLTHLGLALTRSAWVAASILFVFGAHAFIWGTTSITVRQRAVPTHLQGRVGSLNTISVFGGLVIGSAVGGTIASRYGVTAPFWFAFVGSAIFVVALWRELTRIAHSDEPAVREAESAPDAGAAEPAGEAHVHQ
ncbi:MFS transporter [Rugosimonospora africana]|uniref:MFS transporter n=1 Tax=Rugosimonospora africana TaxID=556532 RepID=A0A8J3VNK2_9ACTN|nr:MFS transporter [Rugosimonospora africana]